jgi:hypothetical protein
MGWFSDALFGKKQSTPSYDYVTPTFDYYNQNIGKVGSEASLAPEISLDVGGYTPYGKIENAYSPGQGYTEYDLREVLDPSYMYGGKEYTDDNIMNRLYSDIATGNMSGVSDLASDEQRRKDLIDQGLLQEKENLSDTITKGYYTPYEMALGSHYGQGSEAYAEGGPLSRNPAASTNYNSDWSLSKRYDLGEAGPLLKASAELYPELQDTASWDWTNNDLYDPGYGYFTTDKPEDWKYGFNEQYTPSQTYRSGGLAGILGPILSMIPATAPIGMALSASNAIVNNNPMGLIASILPATGLTQGLSKAIGGATGLGNVATQGLTNATVQGGLAAIGGQDVGKAALAGGLTGSIGAGLQGNQYVSGTGSQYINPAINGALTNAIVSGALGQDPQNAVKNSLMRSAWKTAGSVVGNQFK